MKINKLLLMLSTLPLALINLCSCNMDIKGANAFMTKSTGIHFGEVLYQGFKDNITNNKIYKDEKCFDKSPSEANVGAQVQMIETLAMQKVASITISASGTTGYDEVLKRATKKGIKIVSTDSPISPMYRTVHVNHCDEKQIGTWLARAAVLIACKKPYQKEWDSEEDPVKALIEPVKQALRERKTGSKKIVFGILSSTQDSPSQNMWISFIKKELQDSDCPDLKGKYAQAGIDVDPSIEYGDDEPTKSAIKAQHFIEQNVDVIISPDSVGMTAAATKISDTPNCQVKLTGLGMPSECWKQMPQKEDDNDFDFACPYMMLWDVHELGEVAAETTLQVRYNNQINWKNPGDNDWFNFQPSRQTKMKKYYVKKADDGGTKINACDPLPFSKFNVEYWKDII